MKYSWIMRLCLHVIISVIITIKHFLVLLSFLCIVLEIMMDLIIPCVIVYNYQRIEHKNLWTPLHVPSMTANHSNEFLHLSQPRLCFKLKCGWLNTLKLHCLTKVHHVLSLISCCKLACIVWKQVRMTAEINILFTIPACVCRGLIFFLHSIITFIILCTFNHLDYILFHEPKHFLNIL